MSLRKKRGVYFDLTMPNGHKVKYRSFTVGEVKDLLVARGVTDPAAIINTTLSILSNAVEGVNVNTLPMYLTDYLFLNIYSKSGGNKVTVKYNCPGADCDHSMNVQLDLDKCEVEYPESFVETKLIDVGDGMTIKLRLPSLAAMKALKTGADEVTDMIDTVIFAGIECITDGDDVKVPGVDFTEEELAEWINSLDSGILAEIETFFDRMPEVVLNADIQCPACGHKDTYTIRGIEYFLA